MKVLVAHNLYRSAMPSGENRVVRREIDLLRRAGVEVVTLLEDSDDIAGMGIARRAAVAAGPVVNPYGVRRLSTLLDVHRPDVLHLHNVYPLLSPWAVQVARRAGVPVVQTVHNFRHDCIAGTYFREGSPCTSCTGHALGLAAVQHGCYRGSRLQSVPMALGRSVHRRTWRLLDRYIVLTSFHRDLLVTQGVPADRIVVRPTSADDPGPATPVGRDVLFLGRLSEEKGVALLLAAWERARPAGRRLVIAGDGPLRPAVMAAAGRDQSVRYVGSLDAESIATAIRAAGVVAAPSLWFEGLPHVVIESLSHGRGVMVSSLGGTAAAVGPESGWTVEPDVASWSAALSALDDSTIASRGAAARRRFIEEFDSTRAMRRLLSVYDDVTLAGAA